MAQNSYFLGLPQVLIEQKNILNASSIVVLQYRKYVLDTGKYTERTLGIGREADNETQDSCKGEVWQESALYEKGKRKRQEEGEQENQEQNRTQPREILLYFNSYLHLGSPLGIGRAWAGPVQIQCWPKEG